MKRKLWISLLLLLLIIGGGYFVIKVNPPLEIGTLASSENNKSIVVGVGNLGFHEIKIEDVSINNNEKPLRTRIQVSNAIQGFIITDDDTHEDAKEFKFMNPDEIAIKTGTSPTSYFEKLDKGTASKDDEIYGVSVFHDEEVSKVQISYSYLGISFNETVTLN